MYFRTDDVLQWGTGLGRNLHPVEVDQNFYDLDQRLAEVESNPREPRQIDNFSVVGNELTINMEGGASFGPYILPVAAFNFTEAFQPNHAYGLYDVLTDITGVYLVLVPHTSGDVFNPDEASLGQPFYQLMLEASGRVYDIGFGTPGIPGAGIEDGEAMYTFRATRDFYLPLDLIDSVAGLQDATTDDLSFAIMKNATQIGTLTILAGESVGTFDFNADTQFNAGHRLRVLRPDNLDATARELSVTFRAIKGEAP